MPAVNNGTVEQPGTRADWEVEAAVAELTLALDWAAYQFDTYAVNASREYSPTRAKCEEFRVRLRSLLDRYGDRTGRVRRLAKVGNLPHRFVVELMGEVEQEMAAAWDRVRKLLRRTAVRRLTPDDRKRRLKKAANRVAETAAGLRQWHEALGQKFVAAG